MNRFKIFLPLIWMFILLISCENESKTIKKDHEKISTANWMHEIFASQPNKRITEITIPGTHESLSYDIDSSRPFSSTPIKIWSDSVVYKVGKEGIANFSKVQSNHILQQLEQGIRYLDFRIQVYEDRIYGFNHLVSGLLEPAVDGIATFVNKHPKELVFVDLRTLNIEPPLYMEVLQVFLNRLGDRIAVVSNANINASIGQFWGSETPVILISSFPIQTLRQEKYFYTRSKVVQGLPVHFADSDSLKSALMANIPQIDNSKLNVLPCFITPNDNILLSSLQGPPRDIADLVKMENGFSASFPTWFVDYKNEVNRQGKFTNVMLFDQYQLQLDNIEQLIYSNIEPK